MVRVLIAHNRYRSSLPSGENRVVDTEVRALRAAGLDVSTYIKTSDELVDVKPGRLLLHALDPVRGVGSLRDLERRLQDDSPPDVLHIHNAYPLISMRAVELASRRGIAVVHTVHNYRHTCMSGSYEREGRPCHECRGGTAIPGVLHGCYRDSRAQSAVMLGARIRHRSSFDNIDRFVALTGDSRDELVRLGVEEHRVALKANAVLDPGDPKELGTGFVHAGRLSREKGTFLLLDAWCSLADGALGTLTIAGEGPATGTIKEVAELRRDVTYVGVLSAVGIQELLARSAVLLLPSISKEALPLILLEALAAGRPAIISLASGLQASINPDCAWFVAAKPADWVTALTDVHRHGAIQQARAARRTYLRDYSESRAAQALTEIYEQAVTARCRREHQ